MTEPKMCFPKRMFVKCLDARDRSGDIINELPGNVMEAIGLKTGDTLSVEKVDDVIVLSRLETPPQLSEIERVLPPAHTVTLALPS